MVSIESYRSNAIINFIRFSHNWDFKSLINNFYISEKFCNSKFSHKNMSHASATSMHQCFPCFDAFNVSISFQKFICAIPRKLTTWHLNIKCSAADISLLHLVQNIWLHSLRKKQGKCLHHCLKSSSKRSIKSSKWNCISRISCHTTLVITVCKHASMQI